MSPMQSLCTGELDGIRLLVGPIMKVSRREMRPNTSGCFISRNQSVWMPAQTGKEKVVFLIFNFVFPKGQSQYDTYRSLLGRRVIASGTLFRAHTGHHHTKVLLTVTDIKDGNGTKETKPAM